MEKHELRIGNSLEIMGKAVTVLGVINNRIYYGSNESPCYNYIVDFKPIPLTEKWLTDFGFPKDNMTIELDDILEYYCVYLEDNFCLNSVELKYVHSLQNLYFALTNKELVIKAKP